MVYVTAPGRPGREYHSLDEAQRDLGPTPLDTAPGEVIAVARDWPGGPVVKVLSPGTLGYTGWRSP
jgi:hypothetical protein